jgi:cation:H+ antiporter
MILDLFLLCLSFLGLFLGAEGLVRGSASLARRMGLTPLVIGLTVVAFGTSTPETFVCVSAALKGQGSLAVGKVLGSNILNIGVILGVAALLCPIRVNLGMIKADAPLMIALSALVALLLSGGGLSRTVGFVLFLGFIAYTAMNVILARRQATPDVDGQFSEGTPRVSTSAVRDLLFVLGGIVFLVGSSRLLVVSASGLALSVGMSEAAIGLTIVAIGTSMPELATSVMAAVSRTSPSATWSARTFSTSCARWAFPPWPGLFPRQ